MTTRIREVRRARGLTLEEVASLCEPRTTAQTIGRLETGVRTLSLAWLNRLARALNVEPHALMPEGGTAQMNVMAVLERGRAVAPKKAAVVVPPHIREGQVAVLVAQSMGDYRAGDELWCELVGPEDLGQAVNRDVLIPRPASRFLFGRLINRDAEKLHVLPLEPGGRQQVVATPPWLAVATQLVRRL